MYYFKERERMRKVGETFVFNNDILKVVDETRQDSKWDCYGCYFHENGINCLNDDVWSLRLGCCWFMDDISLKFKKIGENKSTN